jgi:hypothetical protein
MTTQQEYAQRAQYMKNMGFPEAEIQRRLQLQMSAEQAQAAQVEAQQREATNPPPAFSFDRYDEIDRRGMAALNRASDPLRVSQAAAQRARIEAQMRPLVEQRDALNRQIAQLNEELQRWM